MISTQYPLMSGSTFVIFNVKGGVQVRVMLEVLHCSIAKFSEPTAVNVPA
jgi:hypothetical protein